MLYCTAQRLAGVQWVYTSAVASVYKGVQLSHNISPLQGAHGLLTKKIRDYKTILRRNIGHFG